MNVCAQTLRTQLSLSIKALKQISCDLPTNPEKAAQQLPNDDQIRKQLHSEHTSLTLWNRNEVEENGTKRFVTQLIELKLDADQFIKHYKA